MDKEYTYTQHADAKFERCDPFPNIPFADDTIQPPSLLECLGWIAIAACFVGTAIGFLSA